MITLRNDLVNTSGAMARRGDQPSVMLQALIAGLEP